VESEFPQFLMAIGVFAGAVVSGFTGFNFSAVAGAVLLHMLPPSEAVPLMMVCSVLVQGINLVWLRAHVRWRESAALIAGGLLGLPPALYVLLHAEPALFRLGFGVFLAVSGLIPSEATTAYTVRQGIEMGRPSRLDCTVTTVGGAVTEATVRGSVHRVATGEIEVP